MGNTNSSEIDQLKQLYSMNVLQLESLRKELNQQRLQNIQQSNYYREIISNLQNKQNNIKNKIPNNHFNKVDDFLKNIDRDIKSTQSNVNTWKPKSTSSNSNRNYRDNIESQNISNNSGDNNSGDNNSGDNYRSNIEARNNYNNVNNRRNYSKIKKSNNEIDPYKLYQLIEGQPIDLKKLKETYKKYALQTHPDVNGGNDTNFNIVNNAYKFLLEEHSKMQKDKQYTQLKQDSQVYLEKQSKNGMMNSYMTENKNNNNFNLNKFNTIFQENKLEDYSQEGYDSWLKDNTFDSEDIVKDTSLTSSNFNSQFDSKVKVGKELQLFKLPTVLNSTTDNVQELGLKKVENYSGHTGSIKYTDLKEAHTTSRLVDPNTKYKQYKNVNDIESERSNMGDLSEIEKQMIEEYESKQKNEAAKREENQRMMDRLYASHHNKMNNLFLGR